MLSTTSNEFQDHHNLDHQRVKHQKIGLPGNSFQTPGQNKANRTINIVELEIDIEIDI